MSNTIHPTAVVSDQAQLGSGNQVGPFVVIHDDVILGDNNVLHSGVVVHSGSRIGHANRIHEYAVIGGLPQDLGFDPATSSYVTLGDENVLREAVIIHRASVANEHTRLGNHNYLMNGAHLGHDCVLGNHVVIAPYAALGGFVSVADRAFISGGVMIHQFARVGELAMIGGNSKITRDVLPFLITDGMPGRVRGLNVVGLRRAGYPAPDLRALKQAYRILFRGEADLAASLEQLQSLGTDSTSRLAAFIEGSKRGFHRDRE
ncbi:MAG: acyl-ACP--UDP-N-acetylglucosamine O-acyltransferase [Thiohalophilus sp.]|uniref:acyl-ACP--UDP-N-acetylglucosamine O-acyltransferase n=1 Tax=Thiohalophilus sp. TaxID=3028392 RepID=UPI002870757E|nr:acyl-ACP--UDP-N-acetylglucosamine O-acyltransferase [Thiohalophilus sp.]MDR9435969.1 acyl-ACP--UDP-N-acetylglucosamine O-acyltransferase [Thiohalophilus sp.]